MVSDFREIHLQKPLDAEAVRWIDVINDSASPATLYERLSESCHELRPEMLVDLLSPNANPGSYDYADSPIRLASTFSVEARRIDTTEGRDVFERPGLIVFQPVVLLAGDGWLISCWHPRTTYRGIERVGEEPPEDHGGMAAAIDERWAAGKGHSGGDLGLLIMHELALTYAPAHRKLYEWLEQWELGLYVGEKVEREPIGQIWGAVTLFRRWLSPLNPPGLRTDINKAWFAGITDQDECMAVDKRIDKALDRLRNISDTVRTSFSLLHNQLEEDSRKRREDNQHRLEILAALFLVPTLIVGFFGANTWLPGDQHPPGSVTAFVFMVLALIILTVGVISYLLVSRRHLRAEEERSVREHRELRRAMGYKLPE